MEKLEEFVGLKEIAKHIKVHYQTARKMALAGKIPGVHLQPSGKNKHFRAKLSEVDAAFRKTA